VSRVNKDSRSSVVSFGTKGYHARLRARRGRRFATPMDLLWHINLEEMLGDLTVTTFLILLAASVAVVSLMVLFPLIDFAFERKARPTTEEPRHHDGLTTRDEHWQTGRPWLDLRSDFLRPDVKPTATCAAVDTLRQLGSGRCSEPHHRHASTSWLIKRSNTVTQKDRNLIVATKERDVTLRKDDPTASNAVPVVGADKAA
jgi:hypothetical protein